MGKKISIKHAPTSPENAANQASTPLASEEEGQSSCKEGDGQVFDVGAPDGYQTTAALKTAALQRVDLPADVLIPNSLNPNEMDEAEFNMLYDNIERMGVTDPILVRPLENGTYKIIGGHHRWEVAKLHGIEMIPCTVVSDPDFDDDMEKFQTVRHNVIRGKMNPNKFMKLYESLSKKYADDVAAEMFGFTDEEEFKKLIKATAASLPPEMKQQFTDAAKEIKTIDDLALLLNRLFSNYGDTLPYGFMVFDFGGQDHVWVRMEKGQKKQFIAMGDICIQNGKAMDGVITALVQLVAQKNPEVMGVLQPMIDALPDLNLPEAVDMPTLENLEAGSASDLL